MRFFSFGSGSSGNAFLLQSAESSILFDCGIGIRKLRRELLDLGVGGRLDAIVISHEHSDHVRALQSLCRYEDCPVYASSGTFDAIGRQAGWQPLRDGEATSVAGVRVVPALVSHDAAEPLGFLVEVDATRIALFTDLGSRSENVDASISEAQIVVLESNYCESMLRTSSYPAFLKRRIRSHTGHLSNDDCAATLVDSVNPSTQAVWLAHLSENNNTPDVAEAAIEEAFAVRGIGLPARSLSRRDTVDLMAPQNRMRSWQHSLLP